MYTIWRNDGKKFGVDDKEETKVLFRNEGKNNEMIIP